MTDVKEIFGEIFSNNFHNWMENKFYECGYNLDGSKIKERVERSKFRFRMEYSEDKAFFNNVFRGLFGNRRYGLVFKRRQNKTSRTEVLEALPAANA